MGPKEPTLSHHWSLKIKAPILTQGEAILPGEDLSQGREAIHLLRGCLGDIQRQGPLGLRLPGSCKEVGQVIR